MRTVLWTGYGSPEVLTEGTAEAPVPKEHELLIRIHAASVTAGDCELRRLKLPFLLSIPFRLYAGWKQPKRIRTLGQEFSGEVIGMGEQVEGYKTGDKVFGTTGFSFGAYSEYICLPAIPEETRGVITKLPLSSSLEEAAVIPVAGMEVLHYMQVAPIKAGSQLLIIGGGGSIGTAALQLARHHAAEVTVIDHKDKFERLKALGADHLIDYQDGDYTKSDKRYDQIIDVVGRKHVARRMWLLKKGGTYHLAYARLRHILLRIWEKLIHQKRLSLSSSEQSMEDIEALKENLDTQVIKPVVDEVFELSDTAEAHRFAESGRKVGNIAIRIE